MSSRMEEITRRVTKLNASDYPIWVMEKMLQEIEAQRHQILSRMEALEQLVGVKLANGDVTAISDIQVQVRKLRRQDRELEEEFNKLFGYRQAKLLKERLQHKMGLTYYRLKEITVTVLIVFVLGLMVYELLTPNLPDQTLLLFFWLDAGCCAVFLANFFFDLNLAESKRWFWKRHLLDFMTSIPVPQARTLRAFRSARVMRLLRFARFLRFLKLLRLQLFFWRGFEHLIAMFNVRLMRKSLVYVLISLIGGALAFQFFESHAIAHDENQVITSLWWSFTTVVTGGFADIHNPETMGGKLLTVILVIIGMVIIGVFTATLTSVMVGEEDDMELLRGELKEHFEQLMQRVENIERLMETPEDRADF